MFCGRPGDRMAARALLGAALVAITTADHAPATACEKCEALDAYQHRVASGTTGFERRDSEATAPTVAAPAPPASGGNATVNVSAVNFQGCSAEGAEQYAFCDGTLSTKERVEDLLNRFSLDQKLGMISVSSQAICRWLMNYGSIFESLLVGTAQPDAGIHVPGVPTPGG